MTDLEKMARAIADADADWARRKIAIKAPGISPQEADRAIADAIAEAGDLGYAELALAALKAIREPSGEAADIGNGVCDRRCKEGAMANCIFTAMIDHIIAQGEAG